MTLLTLLILAAVVLLLWIVNRRYENRYDVVGLWIAEAGAALVIVLAYYGIKHFFLS